MADDAERGWAIVEHLADVFTDIPHWAAAPRARAGNGVGDDITRQMVR
jgi:hypothetical protein